MASLSDTSINLLSENTSTGKDLETEFSMYSPIRLKKNKSIRPAKISKSFGSGSSSLGLQSVDFSEFETDTVESSDNNFSIKDSKCSYSVRHLSKCRKCYKQLNKLINKKVKEKINDIILDDKLKQLQHNYIPSPNQQLGTTGLSDTWKETLIIIVGAVIAIFIIFLTTKSFNK